MRTEARRRGDIGERAAARYLRRRLFRILERNWFYHRKEVDIIARRGRLLVFCEVKTRTYHDTTPSSYGTPSLAVDLAKRENLLTAAQGYVQRACWTGEVRMDVIEIYLSPPDKKGRVHVTKAVHIKNAFTA